MHSQQSFSPKPGRNSWRTVTVALAILSASGCAGPRMMLLTDPVGPIGSSSVRQWNNPQGTLMVYTEKENVNDGGILYLPNTPYRITTPGGAKVRSVQNRVGLTDQTPTSVALEPGTYHVHALAEGKGWVTVPVVIAPNRLTVVNLESRGLTEANALPENERVRLPDGRVIGRRAVNR